MATLKRFTPKERAAAMADLRASHGPVDSFDATRFCAELMAGGMKARDKDERRTRATREGVEERERRRRRLGWRKKARRIYVECNLHAAPTREAVDVISRGIRACVSKGTIAKYVAHLRKHPDDVSP